MQAISIHVKSTGYLQASGGSSRYASAATAGSNQDEEQQLNFDMTADCKAINTEHR